LPYEQIRVESLRRAQFSYHRGGVSEQGYRNQRRSVHPANMGHGWAGEIQDSQNAVLQRLGHLLAYLRGRR